MTEACNLINDVEAGLCKLAASIVPAGGCRLHMTEGGGGGGEIIWTRERRDH